MGGVKIKKMKTEVRSQESEWGRRSPNLGNAEAWQRTPTKEALKIGIKGLKAGGGGKRWFGSRAYVGKGGQVLGKRTGFAHIEPGSTRLGPDGSTQVVDFPHMYEVRVFLSTEELPQRRRGAEPSWGRNRCVEAEKGRGAHGVPTLPWPVHIWVAVTVTDRPLISEFVRLYANIFAYFENRCLFPDVVVVKRRPTMGGG